MLKITAIATLALAFAGAASAATPLTAVLTSPTDKPVNLVVDGTAWVCAGPACAAKTFGPDAVSWIGCKGLVKVVGPVSAYAGLDAEKLAKCNEFAKT